MNKHNPEGQLDLFIPPKEDESQVNKPASESTPTTEEKPSVPKPEEKPTIEYDEDDERPNVWRDTGYN